jgi:Fe-S-cluster containining protein
VKDGPVRRVLKRVALWNFYANLWWHRARLRARGQEHYQLGGDCRRCARCCEAPAIQVGWLTWYIPFIRRAFLAWQRRVNGFDVTGRDPVSQAFIFRCRHFDWTTRQCDSYDTRPGMCRDYPRLLLEQPAPEFLPGCGYRAVWRNADDLSRALEAANVAPSTLERLRRDLYLDKSDPDDPARNA